jgi:hypothetical protein
VDPRERVEMRGRGEPRSDDPDAHPIDHGPMLAVRAWSTRAGTLRACPTSW